MICTITYNGKTYTEQEFKRLVEASFNNYKATQNSQDAVEAYNTVMKQADALLNWLNQYNIKLDDSTSFEPKEISDESKQKITKELMKIAGLANNHFNYFANYAFNVGAKNFNLNAESITDEKKLKSSIKEDLFNMLDAHVKVLDNLSEKLNIIRNPDDNVVQLNLKKIQVAKNKLELIKDNFDAIADAGLKKLYKFANIKVKTQINEDGTTSKVVEEADDTSKIADMEEESTEDSVTDFEESNTERDENYSQTSLEKNPKNSVRKELRLLMSGIPLTDKDGNLVNTVMGIPAYVDFDTVFDTVIALMADKSLTFDEAISHLEENSDVRPWLKEFVNRLKNTDKQVKNQFLSTMGNHALTMYFVQYSFDKDGKLTLKVMNTNSAELRRKTLNNWRTEFLGSDLVDSPVEGQYFANKNKAKELLDTYNSWFNEDNIPNDLRSVGAAKLLDIHTNFLVDKKDVEVKSNAITKFFGLKVADFKNGEIKKYSVTNKIDGEYNTQELRVKRVGNELKYIFGKPTTPAVSRALKVKPINTGGRTISIMEYNSMPPRDQAEAVNEVLEWLKEFGIDMHPNAIHRIFSGQYYKDKKSKVTPDNFFKMTDSAHQPIGILANWLNKVVNEESTLILDETEDKNHPFRDNAIENGLARFQAKYVENVATSSFRSGKKSIYGYTAYKYVTDRFMDLRTNQDGILEELKDLGFSKNSAWLQWLQNDALPNAFNISHLDLNALKEAGKKIFGDNGITSLADADHELVKLGLFMDMKQGSTNEVFTVDAFDFPMRMASMLFPTMSDKSTMVTIKTPMFKLNNEEYYTYNSKTKRLEANDEILRLLFNQLVLPEIDRILQYKERNETDTNIKDYDKGAKMLMFLPGLNTLQVSYTLDTGDQWKGNLIDLLTSKNFTEKRLNDELKLQIYPELNNYISTLVQNKVKVWEDNELMVRDASGELNFEYFDNGYLNGTKVQEEGASEIKASVIAFDYVINQLIGNANAFMTIIGDPALYYKSSSNDYTKQSKDSFINVGKRLAAMIAPGSKLAESKNEKYYQVFLKDRVSVSENIGFLTKLLDDKEFGPTEVEEWNKITTNPNKKEQKLAMDNFLKDYPNSAAYFAIESTDAQEYTTWQEHLHVLRQTGKTSDKVLSLTDEDLDVAERIFNNNTPFDELSDAEKEIIKQVMQPIKPVYTGQIYDKAQGVMRMMYIKSSSFPLIPQMTAGLELDKLRIALQEFQKSGFKVRASYQTANKVGALSTPLEVFDGAGKIKPLTQQDLERSSLLLNRKDFKIQQDVPFKSGKRKEDTVTMGSQLTKILFGNGIMDLSGFEMDNKSYSGKELQKIYNDTYIELYNLRKQKLYNELGIDETTNQPIDVEETAVKLQQLLKEEALDRGWSKQQIDALEIEFIKDKSGQVVDYKFKLPLWMSAESNRIESLLNAVVNNRLVKIKFPGNAYVAGSEEGFKIQSNFEGIDKSKIVWLNNKFNGKLQAAKYDKEGNLESAQVLVASKFRDKNGNLINLLKKENGKYKYVIKTKQKGFVLNEAMFDKELLDMLTFRIPTSGHMSGSKVTIAGFFPHQSGDLIITPKNFTKQMGQDFDVDKLNSYQLWNTQDESGKFRPVTESDNIENIEEKLLQNKLIKIHTAVFGNKSPEVQKKINAILSTDYAEEQAKMIDDITSAEDQYFTPLSDEYQKGKMALGASGKIGTGAYSLDVTSHSLFEQAKANDKQLQLMVDDKNSLQISFGGIHSTGELGEANTLVVSKRDYFITKMQSLENNDTILDNLNELLKSDDNFETALAMIPGIAQEYPELQQILDDYNKLQRPIAEVLSERQNIAVDNEKLQVMGKVNLNSYTMDVDKVLCMLGFDKGEDGNSLSFLFLSQPIIKDYVAEMNKATSNIKEFNKDAESEVIRKLQEKYFEENALDLLLDTNTSAFDFDKKYGSRLTSEDMYYELIKTKTEDRLNNFLQLTALNRFLMLKQQGLAVRNLQSAINTDSKGLGKSIPENLEKIKTLSGLINSSIKNATALVGDYLITNNLSDEEFEAKLEEGYIPVQNELLIRPNTSIGAVSLNALLTANNLWTKHFPYDSMSFNIVTDEIMNLISNSEANEAKKAEKKHFIVKEIKKYFNARIAFKTLISKSNTVTDERLRLMYDSKEGKVSLAKYLSETIGKHPELKNNKLLQRFNYDIDYSGNPSLILYENTAGSNFDEDGLNNALLELMSLDLKLPEFNGEIYNAKKLAQDLINYALIEGGVQEATQFAKFIPISYLEEMGFTSAVNNLDYNSDAALRVFGIKEDGPSNFAIQFARNNPTLLPKLLGEKNKILRKLKQPIISIKEAGYNLENAPDFVSFREKGKDYLWQKINNQYIALEVAVSKANSGQKLFAYDIQPNVKTPVIAKGKNKGKPKEVSKPTSVIPPIDNSVNKLVNEERFGLGQDDFTTILNNIINSKDLPDNITVILKQLISKINPNITIKVVDNLGSRGTYQKGIIKIDREYAQTTSNENLARTIFKETVHSVTDELILKHTDEDGQLTPKDGVPGAQAARDIITLFERANTALSSGKYAEKYKSMREKFEKLKAGEDVGFDEEEKRILYGTANIKEFIEMMLTQPEFQQAMSEIKLGSSNTTLMDKLRNFIKTVLAAIGVEPGTLTDEAIKSIFQLIEESKPQVQTQPSQRKTYSGKITSLKSNQIFVFGSNPEGRHGKGAAKDAKDLFGAKYGQGRGLQGQSYGLVTKNLTEGFVEPTTGIKYEKAGEQSVSQEQIISNIKELYEVALQNPTKEFLIPDYSKSNLNGYTGQQMADMFNNAGPIPFNIVFNENFDKLIQTQPTTTQEIKVELGRYVTYQGETYIVTKFNNNNTVQIYNPTKEGVDAKKSVAERNLQATTNKGSIVTHKGAEYIVTPKGTIISLTSNKIMKWDENNGDRKAILALAQQKVDVEPTINQQQYNKVKANLSQLIVREREQYQANRSSINFADEIIMSDFNGYPKIIQFLGDAIITVEQLKFFNTHPEYVEAMLNETGATTIKELLAGIEKDIVESEPTASQIEIGMSDSTIADIANEEQEAQEMISESKAGNDIMLFPGVPANAGQTKAIEKLNKFIKDRGKQVFVLKGRGGTGKTTIIKKILEKLDKDDKVAAATITHKAKGVLQNSMGPNVRVGTIASALGLIKDKLNPGNFIVDTSKKYKSPFYDADVIIIDECSMITDAMVNQIINFSKKPNVKIIFMGDNVQLPPIEKNNNSQDKDSSAFTANTKPEYTATLTERMRQGEDSPIVGLSDVIAANVENDEPELRIIKNRKNKFDEKKNTGILFETKDSMMSQLTNDLQNDKENTKIIAYTNVEKNNMNDLAREILWGKGNTNEFNKGEIILSEDSKEATVPVVNANVFNGDQFTVLSSSPVNIKFNKLNDDFSETTVFLPGYSLVVQNESGREITMKVLSFKSKEDYKKMQEENKKIANSIGGNMRNTLLNTYWNNEDSHVKIEYGYAVTSHDSQGSTYNNAYIMEDNILGVQDASVKNKNQSLYVAVTRPRYKAVIVSNKNASAGELKTFESPINITKRGTSFEPKEISEQDINNLPKLDCE